MSQRGRLLNRLGDTAQRVLTDHDAIDYDLDIVLELLVQIDRIVERAHFTVDTHAAKVGTVTEIYDYLRLLFALFLEMPWKGYSNLLLNLICCNRGTSMTEDIPLEITSSDMANLPIFIAVLIVATVVVRVYFSIKHNEKPPIARVFWCATLLIPLGMVAAWITNQLLVNEDNSLWVLSYSALGATAVILLVEPLVSGLIDQTDLAGP